MREPQATVQDFFFFYIFPKHKDQLIKTFINDSAYEPKFRVAALNELNLVEVIKNDAQGISQPDYGKIIVDWDYRTRFLERNNLSLENGVEGYYNWLMQAIKPSAKELQLAFYRLRGSRIPDYKNICLEKQDAFFVNSKKINYEPSFSLKAAFVELGHSELEYKALLEEAFKNSKIFRVLPLNDEEKIPKDNIPF